MYILIQILFKPGYVGMFVSSIMLYYWSEQISKCLLTYVWTEQHGGGKQKNTL